MRKIPIFLSCPTQLNRQQDKSREIILNILEELQMEPRALGRGDYPKDTPLKEIYVIARHCSGGIILGFEQTFVNGGALKRGTKEEKKIDTNNTLLLPTPWNHIEAGILFGLKLPILIFKEDGVTGGVFDLGTMDVFVHKMPSGKITADKREELKQVFYKWQAEVLKLYYNY